MEDWQAKAHRDAEAVRDNPLATIRVPGGEVLASSHRLPHVYCADCGADLGLRGSSTGSTFYCVEHGARRFA